MSNAEDYAGLGREARVASSNFDDLDVEIVKCRFAEFVYRNKAGNTVGKPTLALLVTFKAVGDTKLTKPIEETYSAGDLKFFKPNADGTGIRKVAGHNRTGLATDCHAALFLDAAETADPSLAGWKQGVAVLEGRRVHLTKQLFPTQQKKDNKKLAIASFLTGGAGSSGSANGGGANVDAEAQLAIIAAVKGAGEKGITKAKLSQALFAQLEGNPNRSAISAKAIDAEFLKAGAKDDLWNFDGKTLTAAADEE